MFAQRNVGCRKTVEIGGFASRAVGRSRPRKTQHPIGATCAIRRAVLMKIFTVEIDIERLRASHILSDQRLATAAVGYFRLKQLSSRRFLSACFQQRVSLHFFSDKRFDFERRQCEQFYGLL